MEQTREIMNAGGVDGYDRIGGGFQIGWSWDQGANVLDAGRQFGGVMKDTAATIVPPKPAEQPKDESGGRWKLLLLLAGAAVAVYLVSKD